MKYTKPKAEVVEVAVARDFLLSSLDWDILPEFTIPEAQNQNSLDDFYEN